MSNPSSRFSLLSLSALGIVFGDIGTSPLYAYKTVLILAGCAPNTQTILGSVSLIVWTLMMITSIKYISLAMRMDNDGEGGILALMFLLGLKTKSRPTIVVIGLMGAALIYGDGAMTPSISVLSALEGLHIISPSFEVFILPSAIIILILLFAIQPKGTANIGAAFGPIMAIWFCTIGLLGVYGVIQHPSIMVALNPMYGLSYLFTHGSTGFLLLGGVFLCVTGAEALYADMGHFGAKAIRTAWFWVVFPCLILNYLGQAALVLDGVSIEHNIFYTLCPREFLIPLVLLATIATIIASQSIITGVFSMTRQAIKMGWLPRLRIIQTSSLGVGQIYVGAANWLLMFATLGVTIGFASSNELASAYGIAVSATMLLTSVLLFTALREVWHWGVIKAGVISGLFILIDGAFLGSNLLKFTHGGYVPIMLAIFIVSIMTIWHKGIRSISVRLREKNISLEMFMDNIKKEHLSRVPGTAVFMTRSDVIPPAVMIWHVKKNHVLHQQVFILTVNTLSIPWCKKNNRLSAKELGSNVWRIVVNYGFMEQPNIPHVLENLNAYGYDIHLTDMTYYLGHETIIPRENGSLIRLCINNIFAFMHRNAFPAGQYLRLPPDAILEIGRQINI